jgi:hypothetical protein
MISHTGHQTRDHGPHCYKCQINPVKFSGALCFLCREEARDKKAMGAVVLIFLCAALLIMGLASAYGQWVRM